MRKLLTIIMFVMTAGCLYAQNGIYIKMADGRTFSFSKDNIQKLSFKSEGQMQVETKNGQTYTTSAPSDATYSSNFVAASKVPSGVKERSAI